jgi:hypothetical protein
MPSYANTDNKETLQGIRYCSIYISYDLVVARAKLTQFPSKKYPVHFQPARRMRGGGRAAPWATSPMTLVSPIVGGHH